MSVSLGTQEGWLENIKSIFIRLIHFKTVRELKTHFTSLSQKNYSENEAEFSKRIEMVTLRTFSGFSLFRFQKIYIES